MLTDAEIKAEAKLTAKESRAITALTQAARRLPKGIVLDVNEEGLVIRKLITPGYAHCVTTLKRKSLKF